jgi:hypothetical protein
VASLGLLAVHCMLSWEPAVVAAVQCLPVRVRVDPHHGLAGQDGPAAAVQSSWQPQTALQGSLPAARAEACLLA